MELKYSNSPLHFKASLHRHRLYIYEVCNRHENFKIYLIIILILPSRFRLLLSSSFLYSSEFRGYLPCSDTSRITVSSLIELISAAEADHTLHSAATCSLSPLRCSLTAVGFTRSSVSQIFYCTLESKR